MDFVLITVRLRQTGVAWPLGDGMVTANQKSSSVSAWRPTSTK